MKKIFLALFFVLLPLNGFAVSLDRVEDLQTLLNQSLKSELILNGYQDIHLLINSEVPEYAGGMNIRESNIEVIIGAQQFSIYSEGALRFLLCHEVGHALGGVPYKGVRLGRQYSSLKISHEAQADYWAGAVCVRKLGGNAEVDAQEFFKSIHDSLGRLVTGNPFYAPPVLDLEDNYFYDSEYPSFQCRYNSAVAGYRGLERPACWYPVVE